ncbi:MAG: hypothetical protein ACF788_08920 [Novipirellula sp. JB048]
MTNGPLSREFEIFVAALDRPISERETFLDECCGEDSPLRERVQRLLASHLLAEAAETLEHHPKSIEPEMPKVIGPYEVRSRLGEGGMGVVYAAEQHHPIRRSVAVKLLKWGSDSTEVLGPV